MTKKKNASQGDFRYAVGNAKVPWQAVGEYFKKDDVLEMIKFFMPDTRESSRYNSSFAEVRKAVAKLAKESGEATKLTLGRKVQDAEALAKEYLKVKHACFLTNWTAGMEIGYKLSGLRAGDEVIMPAITFIATMAYPLMIGAKVVFADIDPKTANLDPADVARKITSRTKVIVPVHIGGCPCDMDPIMALASKHSIFVMEDAAHGLGGMYKGRALGTIGHFGGYSLHEVKNINSFGEGGVLVTNLDCGEQFARARFLGLDFSRQIKDWLYDITPLTDRFGMPQVPGNHSAMEIQGLGFIRQMKRLDKIIAARKAASEYMNGVLAEEAGIILEKADTAKTYSTHHLYLLNINPKKAGGNIQTLKRKLTEKGLTCITHFGPMYRFNIMKQLGYDENRIASTCPVTEEMFHNCYTHLPLYPLTRKQLEYQAGAVVEAVREMKKGV
jgi:dTDP-4-amino-4,6-dideoxygalactose transaminase